MAEKTAPRWKKALFGLVAAVILFCLLEGALSLLFLGVDLARTHTEIAEAGHTDADEELGWVNTPELALTDFYGPGRHFHTNAAGFRGLTELASGVPDDTIRIVCSGDSFTLGYGVDDSQTWPHHLQAMDERIETVNMGQGGYGIDQAYLWYQRERANFEHHVQVLAFIFPDFERVSESTFLGTPKSPVRLVDGELAAEPSTGGSTLAAWTSRNSRTLRRLSVFRAIGALAGDSAPDRISVDETKAVVAKIFETLAAQHAAEGTSFVLVYLPMFSDSVEVRPSSWRRWSVEEAARQGIAMIDLGSAFQSLPMDELESLYLRKEEVDFYGAAGHYTDEGNRRIAALIHSKLVALPEIASRLE